MSAMAKQVKQPIISECDAGLIKIVVPIFVNDEFIGSVGACGLLPDDSEVDAFIVNRTLEIGEDKIKSLSNDIKRVTADEAEAVCKYITEQIEKIIKE
jgi:ligand-binding sensor protein